MKRIISFILALCLLLFSLCSCDGFDLFGLFPSEIKLVCHYLDIGQGDSIFIELPNRQTMLIDSGENYHGAGIIDYIESRGYKRIDYLVATHPHADHIGSMPYIVRNFDIGSIYMPKVSTNSSIYEDLLKAVKSKKLSVVNTKAGLNILKDEEINLSADVAAPVKLDRENLNNSSLVIRLKYKDSSFLFTGDAENEEISAIKSDISADVLKVGHHGSSNSTTKEFLEKVNPKIAVISCGAHNDYGHPHKSVLKLLKQAKCEVYRTDKSGTVSVASNGSEYEVNTGLNSIVRSKK